MSSLGIVNRGLFLYLDNVNLQNQITTIADEIRNELKTQIVRETALVVDIETEAIIDMRYLFYVEKYGAPIGGVFDPVKLAEFV